MSVTPPAPKTSFPPSSLKRLRPELLVVLNHGRCLTTTVEATHLLPLVLIRLVHYYPQAPFFVLPERAIDNGQRSSDVGYQMDRYDTSIRSRYSHSSNQSQRVQVALAPTPLGTTANPTNGRSPMTNQTACAMPPTTSIAHACTADISSRSQPLKTRRRQNHCLEHLTPKHTVNPSD